MSATRDRGPSHLGGCGVGRQRRRDLTLEENLRRKVRAKLPPLPVPSMTTHWTRWSMSGRACMSGSLSLVPTRRSSRSRRPCPTPPCQLVTAPPHTRQLGLADTSLPLTCTTPVRRSATGQLRVKHIVACPKPIAKASPAPPCCRRGPRCHPYVAEAVESFKRGTALAAKACTAETCGRAVVHPSTPLPPRAGVGASICASQAPAKYHTYTLPTGNERLCLALLVGPQFRGSEDHV